MPDVAIFLNQCLPVSEIFVYQQAKALQSYRPHLVACNRVTPSVAGDLPATILNDNNAPLEKIREQVFKATGHSGLLQRVVEKTDLIHAHFGPTGWLASGIAQRTGKPLVVTLHGFDVLKDAITRRNDGPLQATYARHRAKLGARASRFICVSAYVRQRAIAFGFPAEKCVVRHMGIPVPPPTNRPPRTAGGPVRLVAVGRLVPFKGHAKLIAAVATVQQTGRDVRLDIVGDGPLRATLEKDAATQLKNYMFHGVQPHDSVLDLMRGGDIFCHTAFRQPNGQTEAFGLVLLEAQIAGLPVVAFASGGVPDAFADGLTGLAVPEGNVADFAAALCRLIDDPAQRVAMAAAAPGFVAAHFDSRKLTTGLEKIYDDVIRQGSASK